ncbi:MAG: heterodisulfide reductase-related iron-sulfur binding cluster [Myxococcota bacterium]
MSFVVTAVTLLMLLGAIGFSGYKFLGIWALMRSGRPEQLTDNPKERAAKVVSLVFGHKKVLEDKPAGSMHVWFLYGFLILGIGHTELVLTGLSYFLKSFGVAPFLYESFLPAPLAHLYHMSQDLLAFGVIVVSFIALGRRWSGKVKRLMPRSSDAEIILWWIVVLYVTFFVLVPTGFVLRGYEPGFAWWAPFSSLLATHVFAGMGEGVLNIVHWSGFWAHMTVFLGFACYIPISKHMHLVWAGPNIYFHKKGPKGVPQPIDFETAEKYGTDRVTEYSWKTLLDTFACTECGRCDAVCPANITGKPLKPRKVLHDIKENLRHKNADEVMKFRDKLGRPLKDKAEEIAGQELPIPLILRDEMQPNEVDEYGRYLKEEGQIHVDTLWACTTCAACIDACPVLIDSVPGSLIELRQNLVMMESDFPQQMTTAFKGMENQANPWGVGQDKREDWAEGLGVKTFAEVEAEEEGREVDYLFWVGCAASTDDRAKRTQKALVKVLKRAGVDFAILGCEESCTGDPARRMGNEYLWDMLARQNVEVLNSKKFKKIFTTCPHCMNSLGNEYKQVGGDYEVLHHTQLLDELLKDKRIPLDTKRHLEEHVTYHDPCYLGRYNEVYEEPREVLVQLGVKTSEMQLTKKKSMCCGAGGGRMFMEEHIGKRINVERTEQAMATGAKTIAVGCPFCMTMLTDGTKAKDAEESVKVKDIAELLAERLAPEEESQALPG